MKVGHWVDVQSSGGSSSSRRQPRRDSGLIIYILEETYLWSFPRRRDNIRFSKMGKSRSGDSGCSAGGSHSNSIEVEECCAPAEQTPPRHHRHLLGSSESVESGSGDLMALPTPPQSQTQHDGNNYASLQDSTMPASSPPPSYERVLEEVRELRTRLQRSLAEEEDAIEESSNGEVEAPPPETKKKHKKKPPKPQKSQEIVYKSSKEFYRAMAKQWGITCKMSDNCRCLDCQSRYFDCGYQEKYCGTGEYGETKYHEQSDGGLSASTPMFVSEMMHGSACLLL
uniref:DUF4802 domain-containing protein n=1 Tax=Trichogramma kaykai TaxID=54128 RepID=A0ABD2XGK1_9HYME